MKSFRRILFPLSALFAAVVPVFSQAPVSVRVRLEPLPGAKALRPGAAAHAGVVLQRRANALGVDCRVATNRANELTVTLPGQKATAAKRRRQMSQIVRNVSLEFIWLKDVRSGSGSGVAGSPKARYLYEGATSIRDLDNGHILTQAEIHRKILHADPGCLILSGADLKPNGAQADIVPGASAGNVVMRLQFGESGARRLANFTRSHIGALLAVVLNGRIQAAPWIKDPILDGTAIIQGAGTEQETQNLASMLNAGAFPCRLIVLPRR